MVSDGVAVFPSGAAAAERIQFHAPFSPRTPGFPISLVTAATTTQPPLLLRQLQIGHLPRRSNVQRSSPSRRRQFTSHVVLISYTAVHSTTPERSPRGVLLPPPWTRRKYQPKGYQT